MACFRSTTLLVLIVAFFIIAIGITGTNARKILQAGAAFGDEVGVGVGVDVGVDLNPLGGINLGGNVGGGGGAGSP